MRVRFLSQPFPGGQQAGVVLQTLLESGEYKLATFLVAWAKASGLRRLQTSLGAFRAAGGTCTAIIGIDESGATKEGLELALGLFDETHIFHDPGSRTFHPKVFLFESEREACIVVGSSNLTRGGLYSNYEVSLRVDLDLGSPEDAAILGDVKGYIDRCRSAGEASLRLTAELIAAILADERLRIGSEATGRGAGGVADGGEEHSSLFGAALTGLLQPPPLATPARAPGPRVEAAPAPPPPAAVAPGFWKMLSDFDVSTSSAPGQMIIPIRFLPFFGALQVEHDRVAEGGSRQSHKTFAATFRDGAYTRDLPEVRVILYEPASDHPRSNKELRLTLHDRESLLRLSEDDVLVFTIEDGRYVVARQDGRPPGATGRYGWL